MFTKNARPWFDYVFGGWNTITNHSPQNAYDGQGQTTVYNYTFQNLFNALGTFATEDVKKYGTSSSRYCYGVAFGTGTGVVSENDYTFFGSHIIGLNSNNVTIDRHISLDSDKKVIKYKTTYTISNTLGNDITIGEVGLFFQSTSANSSGSRDKNYAFLFEHSILESPITILSGEVGRITYTIEMDYPTST